MPSELKKEWDPLVDTSEVNEIISAAKRRQMQNIIKSYTGYYDPISELIQNALDAVDTRTELDEKFDDPTIWIEINLKENYFTIMDNGIGFSEDELTFFLKPDISFKTKGNTRGNKGVGSSYLAYGFNHLEIGTKRQDFHFFGIIKNGREWVEDSSNATPRPKVKPLENLPPMLEKIEQGSIFTLKFVGQNIRPKDLSWIQADNATKWIGVLRILTPLGGIYLDGNIPKTKCIVSVISTDGKKTEESVDPCEYLYPHRVIPSSANLGEIIKTQEKLVQEGKDPLHDLQTGYKQLDGIYEVWTADSILKKETSFNPQLSDRDKAILLMLNPTIYGFFSYSVNVWDYVNDKALSLRPGGRILRGGLQMATKNMPQGGLITIPLTKSIGYQKSSHVIFSLSNADPDLGRKGFQPEVVKLASELSVAVVNHLKKWNKLLKRDSGSPLDINADKTRYDWIQKHEEYQRNNPLKINNENFFLPMKEISILSKPLSEQDTVVLFHQLIAGGVIRGLRILATSSNEQYDGIYKVEIKEPTKNHEYDKTENPLGILPTSIRIGISSPYILEYKFNFDALINDFEKDEKNEKDIDLVVCWETGEKWKQQFSIIPLLHEENIKHRPFHGVTHEVKSINSDARVFYIIVLSELVDYLNDPVKAQDYQQKKYIENV